MKRKSKKIIALSIIVTLSMAIPAMADEWKQDAAGWWYEKTDGTYSKSAWENIGGTWYCFNDNGYMHTGWLQQGQDWYYLDASGAMLHDVTRNIDGVDYTFVSDGRMTTNTEQLSAVSREQTEQWFYDSYALIINLTDWNKGYFKSRQGIFQNEAQYRLQKGWGIKDKASAEEKISWLMNSGHRSSYQSTMNLYTHWGYMDLSQRELENEFKNSKVALDMIQAYKTYGAGAIDAWDYCRAMQVLREAYLAGYYTETEMLDRMLDTARIIQNRFTSWDDMAESYARGAEYWKSSPSEYSARKSLHEQLKQYTGYYQSDWNLALQKSW